MVFFSSAVPAWSEDLGSNPFRNLSFIIKILSEKQLFKRHSLISKLRSKECVIIFGELKNCTVRYPLRF